VAGPGGHLAPGAGAPLVALTSPPQRHHDRGRNQKGHSET
jgi:hypothetical protein